MVLLTTLLKYIMYKQNLCMLHITTNYCRGDANGLEIVVVTLYSMTKCLILLI